MMGLPSEEDGMKLLDKAWDKMIEVSKPVQALSEGLKSCAEGLERLASTLSIIAHNQAIHHSMIIQMWSTHQIILKKLNENSLDMSMPDGKKEEKAKPN